MNPKSNFPAPRAAIPTDSRFPLLDLVDTQLFSPFYSSSYTSLFCPRSFVRVYMWYPWITSTAVRSRCCGFPSTTPRHPDNCYSLIVCRIYRFLKFMSRIEGLCTRSTSFSPRWCVWRGELKRGEKGSFFPRFVVLSPFHISIFFGFDKRVDWLFFFLYIQSMSRCVRFLCRLNNS